MMNKTEIKYQIIEDKYKDIIAELEWQLKLKDAEIDSLKQWNEVFFNKACSVQNYDNRRDEIIEKCKFWKNIAKQLNI